MVLLRIQQPQQGAGEQQDCRRDDLLRRRYACRQPPGESATAWPCTLEADRPLVDPQRLTDWLQAEQASAHEADNLYLGKSVFSGSEHTAGLKTDPAQNFFPSRWAPKKEQAILLLSDGVGQIQPSNRWQQDLFFCQTHLAGDPQGTQGQASGPGKAPPLLVHPQLVCRQARELRMHRAGELPYPASLQDIPVGACPSMHCKLPIGAAIYCASHMNFAKHTMSQ